MMTIIIWLHSSRSKCSSFLSSFLSFFLCFLLIVSFFECSQIFDTRTGVVVCSISVHSEEVYNVKVVKFKGSNYIVSASEDGTIVKSRVSDDWKYDEHTGRSFKQTSHICFNTSNDTIVFSFTVNILVM
jgi:hypothetical protein